MKWARVVVCVVNIVNPAVDGPPLLNTFTDRTYLGQYDHWVCPHMSHDFDLPLIFDLDIGVNTKFRVDCQPLLHTCTLTDSETNLGQDDHWVCPHMSCDFDLHLTFDFNIGVNSK